MLCLQRNRDPEKPGPGKTETRKTGVPVGPSSIAVCIDSRLAERDGADATVLSGKVRRPWNEASDLNTWSSLSVDGASDKNWGDEQMRYWTQDLEQ